MMFRVGIGWFQAVLVGAERFRASWDGIGWRGVVPAVSDCVRRCWVVWDGRG